MMFRLGKIGALSCLLAVSTVDGYQLPASKPAFFKTAKQSVQSFAAAAALTAMLASEPAYATSSTAAQISLNSLPPSTISVQVKEIPVIGNLVSGTYAKVADGSVKNPSITIKLPSDKIKALKNVASGGHLEVDVNGVLSTHLDVDVAADEAGVAKIQVASNLIPKLPFKNSASASYAPVGGKESEWSVVTNLGSGESYYFNEKTSLTQFEKPIKF